MISCFHILTSHQSEMLTNIVYQHQQYTAMYTWSSLTLFPLHAVFHCNNKQMGRCHLWKFGIIVEQSVPFKCNPRAIFLNVAVCIIRVSFINWTPSNFCFLAINYSVVIQIHELCSNVVLSCKKKLTLQRNWVCILCTCQRIPELKVSTW